MYRLGGTFVSKSKLLLVDTWVNHQVRTKLHWKTGQIQAVEGAVFKLASIRLLLEPCSFHVQKSIVHGTFQPHCGKCSLLFSVFFGCFRTVLPCEAWGLLYKAMSSDAKAWELRINCEPGCESMECVWKLWTRMQKWQVEKINLLDFRVGKAKHSKTSNFSIWIFNGLTQSQFLVCDLKPPLLVCFRYRSLLWDLLRQVPMKSWQFGIQCSCYRCNIIHCLVPMPSVNATDHQSYPEACYTTHTATPWPR